ncbi:MAG: flagellar biosynthetic protein FliR [Gemmatimonadetes bacterium]|nr:flagellar biosynthetic protein FliR [Gemmatimonadota bacterium]
MTPVAPFDPLAAGSPEMLVLFGTRVGGLVLLAPVFSSTVVPRLARVGLIVLLTALLQPAALAAAAAAHLVPAITPAALLGETLVGLAMGLGAALIVGAAETAGDVMSMQIGLSGAAILDPLDNTQVAILGTFMRLFAVTLLLTLNLHTVMLGALADSTVAVPVGTPLWAEGGVWAMVMSAGQLFALGVRFAAPVIAVVMVSYVAMAILGRAAPQLNILSVSFPVQIALGLGTLLASLPAIARWFTGWSGAYAATVQQAAAALTAVPR